MLKLLILPVPVAFGTGSVEGPILLRGECAGKVAKAMGCLEVVARGERVVVNLLVSRLGELSARR